MKKRWIKEHNKHECPECGFTYWDNKSWNYCPKCGTCLGAKYMPKKSIRIISEENFQLTIDI